MKAGISGWKKANAEVEKSDEKGAKPDKEEKPEA